MFKKIFSITLVVGILVFVSLALILSCKKKTTTTPSTPTGNITFWSDGARGQICQGGCGSCPQTGPWRVINVNIDGKLVGQITTFQTVAPGSCVQSNQLLVVSTTQGQHSVSFTDNCCTGAASGCLYSFTDNINLTSDCYVYCVH
jgi:hypothetical protein